MFLFPSTRLKGTNSCRIEKGGIGDVERELYSGGVRGVALAIVTQMCCSSSSKLDQALYVCLVANIPFFSNVLPNSVSLSLLVIHLFIFD